MKEDEKVQEFKNILQEYGVIGASEQLDDTRNKVYKNAINMCKGKKISFTAAMHTAIQEEYGERLRYPFEWSDKIIQKNLSKKIEDLIIKIENEKMKVSDMGSDEDIVSLIINNFTELGKRLVAYKGSCGTDGSPTLNYKCYDDHCIYYIIGKRNPYTNKEEMQVFYNEGVEFNILNCHHICAGTNKNGDLKKLWEACRSKVAR